MHPSGYPRPPPPARSPPPRPALSREAAARLRAEEFLKWELEWEEAARSRAEKLLEWQKELKYPKHALNATAKKALIEENAKRRADGFLCPLCQEMMYDGIALVPCGHRVCRECWAEMRGRGAYRCPQCRAPIFDGMPQDSWPDQHPLYARFGVEVGGAQEALRGRERRFCVEARELAPSHSDGADWQLNGTTTNGLASMKSAGDRDITMRFS